MFFLKHNKYLVLSISLLLLATLTIEFTSSYIINEATTNWKQTSKNILENIEKNTAQKIRQKHNSLNSALELFVKEFSNLRNMGSNNYLPEFNLTSKADYKPYQFYIFDKDTSLVVWSESSNQSLQFASKGVYMEGEYFFTKSNLTVSLTKYKRSQEFYIFILEPVEKEYRLNSNYYNEISLSKELTDEYTTEVVVDYVSTKQSTKDGRYYSFPVYNNFNNTIAYVTVHAPRISTYKSEIRSVLISFQSYMLIATLFLLGITISKNRDLIKSRSLKFTIFLAYIILIRLIIHWFSLPTKIFGAQLTNSSFFESTFAFGLFQSPVDFFISAILIMAVIIQGAKYFLQFLGEKQKPVLVGKLPALLIQTAIAVIFLLTVRGFGASMRSIVFESTLRYFKYPFVFPDIPTLLMDINILILGLCALSFLIFLVVIALRVMSNFGLSQWATILISFTLIQLLALVYDLTQLQPQGNALLRISLITLVFTLAFFLNKFRSINITYIISSLFAASILTISYLIYFNSDYEIKSLRTTAFDLIKPNPEEINNIVESSVTSDKVISQLMHDLTENNIPNYDAVAFRIWSNSKLEGEKVSSLVNIISSNKELLGSFNYNFEEDFIWDWSARDDSLLQLTSITSQLDNTGNKIHRSINPIYLMNKLIGYLEISVLLDYYTLDFNDDLEIIGSSKAIENSPINTKQLKIFDFQDGELINYYTDLILSETETNFILNAELDENNEAWLNLALNDLGHIIYVKKVRDPNKERFIAVALAEKELSWNLFNFFKIFLIHSLFILLTLIAIYIFHLRKFTRITFTFRTKLLFSFIIISTLPLLLLALYFKNLTEDKNTSAIYYKLGKRADRIEKYINDYSRPDTTFTDELLLRASNDTGIMFDLYQGKDLIFSSNQVYHDVGLISNVINANVYKSLLLTGRTDYVVTEKIENQEYHSFYHKAKISGQSYLVGVNDLFNGIQLPMSAAEVDIFLLGSYSLAIILVIAFSTILANQISSPIRRLTQATSAVAGGNLNISIDENIKGEVGELVETFNKMVSELQKNQTQLANMEREAAWKEMAKQVAHEIKNPLTPMKLAIQQLIAAKEDNSKKYDEIFIKVTDTVIKQIDILKNIATEFSSFAKMPDLKLSEVNLIELINNVATLFSEEKIDIDINTFSDVEIITTDVEQLQRTLINLTRNSLQAGATKLFFEINKTDEKITVRVIDDGKGIPDAIQSKIFDANFTTKVEGMGLGLNMAKRFFDSTNATIEIESSNSSGTIIIINFNTIH